MDFPKRGVNDDMRVSLPSPFSLGSIQIYSFVNPHSNINFFMVIKTYVMFPIPREIHSNPWGFLYANLTYWN